MELCVHDKTTANPSSADIVAAIDASPHPADWYLVLESDDSFIDAGELADGTYEVTASDQGRSLQADESFDADRLKAVLAKFLAGDRTWRDMGFSQVANAGAKAGSGTVGPAGSAPPAWALGIVIGTIAIVVIAFMFDVRSFLGFGDSDLFYVGLIGAPLLVLLAVAVLVKMLEVRRASTWTTAAGRVVKSSTQAHRHGFAGEATTVTTVPLVEYEFSVGGSTFRGNRISIGEDSGGANTEATLRRYRVGTVVSVYYDPGNPGNCVLEREIPKGVGKGLLFLLAFVAAVAFGIYYLATNGSLLLASLPDSIDNKPFVIIAACFGFAVFLFFIASYRLSRRAADWPQVRGKVLQSGSEQVMSNDSRGRTRITYTPVVEYRYSVNGVAYVSRQIKLGLVMSSSQSYATKVAARYPKGRDVDVHYDPANPSSAALENPSAFHWLLLAVALGCFALAARAGGFI